MIIYKKKIWSPEAYVLDLRLRNDDEITIKRRLRGGS
jgi:hypothetical protein